MEKGLSRASIGVGAVLGGFCWLLVAIVTGRVAMGLLIGGAVWFAVEIVFTIVAWIIRGFQEDKDNST